MSRLRLLDFDDLFLLSHLLEGSTIAATAKQLGLTQPAITQRVRKIERVFGQALLQKVGRHVRLTPDGRAVCGKAADALALMRGVTAEMDAEMLTVGAVPLLYTAWLWPAVATLRDAHPARWIHCHVGPADEVAAMLATGTLAATLTYEAPASSALATIELGDEEFLMVAAPSVAGAVRQLEDLEQQVLLEVDRAQGLLARIAATSRAQLRLHRLWVTGDTSTALQAALAGQGVAILPERLVRPALEAKRLVALLPELEIEPLSLRLIYRRDRASLGLVELLASTLTAKARR